MKAATWILLALALAVVHAMVWLSTLPAREGDPWIIIGFVWLCVLTTAAFVVSEKAYRWLS